MASIEAQIAIILKGTSELNKLQSKLNAIQATADQISQQAFDIDLGRVSDLTTYANALKAVNAELEKTDANFKAQSAATQQNNAEIKRAIKLESQLRRERSLVSRFTREFTIETKGLDQSAGQLKDIKNRFDNLKKAFSGSFALGDVGIIRELRNELRSLVQEQRDWNRTLTGTKKTGVNADFLQEQARGYKIEIDALKARAQALGENEEILRKLGAAERNLVAGRSKQGTFLDFADPRLGKEQLDNVRKLIQEQEKQRRSASDAVKENERLSAAAVALEKQRATELEKIANLQEKISSFKPISQKAAEDYLFQTGLTRFTLPPGKPDLPSVRGGARARKGLGPLEYLGGSRTQEEADEAFKYVEERATRASRAIRNAFNFKDVFKSLIAPDQFSSLEAAGKALRSLAGVIEDAGGDVKSQTIIQERIGLLEREAQKILERAELLEAEQELLAKITKIQGELSEQRAKTDALIDPKDITILDLQLKGVKSLVDVEDRLAADRRKSAAEERKSAREESKARQQRISDLLRIGKLTLGLAGKAASSTVDALTFGRGPQTIRGTRNAAIRGGAGLGVLGAGKLATGVGAAATATAGFMTEGPQSLIGGPAIAAITKFSQVLNSALGGIPDIVAQALAAIGQLPDSLGLAAVAAFALAPAVNMAGKSLYNLGKAVGNTAFGRPVSQFLRDINPLAGAAFGSVQALQQGLDKLQGKELDIQAIANSAAAVNKQLDDAYRKLPLALPAGGESPGPRSSFGGTVEYNPTVGALTGGGARKALENAELLVGASGSLAARTDEAAAATLLFAERLGAGAAEATEASNKLEAGAQSAKRIAEYVKQAQETRGAQAETPTQRFIRENIERGRRAKQDEASAEAARERSRLLVGAPYSLSQVPARGELFPGGRTETRQPDYREMLNNLARVRQLQQEMLEAMTKQQGFAATLGQLERKTINDKGQSLKIQQQENEELERSIQIIRERNKLLRNKPIAAMTPEQRVAGGILDPASLRQQRLGRVKRGRKGQEAIKRAGSEGLVGGAFPLLFGQGAGASAGGFTGGVLGGLAGGGLGFGLSLLGTVLGTAVDEADRLDKELAKVNASAKGVGNTSADVNKLASSLGIAKEEAINLLAQFKQFGSAQIRKDLALVFGGDRGAILERLESIVREEDALQAIAAARKEIGNQEAISLLNTFKIQGSAQAQLVLREALLRISEKEVIEEKKRITLQDQLLAGLATAGGGDLVDPKIFGEKRAKEQQKAFDKERDQRRKNYDTAIKESQEFFKELDALSPSGKGSKDASASNLLSAIDTRNEAIDNARKQREQQIADIRKQAIEAAARIEEDLADKRKQIEREIQDVRRSRADSAIDADIRFRELRGEDPGLIEAERELLAISREDRDARIELQRRLGDEEEAQAKVIAEFEKGVAKQIQDANLAGARAIGEIQSNYAKQVAKIVEEGSDKAGKRLAKAAEMVSLYMQRGTQNNMIGGATGFVIPERRNGIYNFGAQGPKDKGDRTRQQVKEDRTFQGVPTSIENLLRIDDKLDQLKKDLNMSRKPDIGQQFTALLGAEGGFEDIAGLEPLPIQKMYQQVGRPFTQLYKQIQRDITGLYAMSRREAEKVLKPDPKRTQAVLKRAERVETVRQTWNPLEAQSKELLNRTNPAPRSKPSTMSLPAFDDMLKGMLKKLLNTTLSGMSWSGGVIKGDLSSYLTEGQLKVIRDGSFELVKKYGLGYVERLAQGAFKGAIRQGAELNKIPVKPRGGVMPRGPARSSPLEPNLNDILNDDDTWLQRFMEQTEPPRLNHGFSGMEGASLPGAGFDMSSLSNISSESGYEDIAQGGSGSYAVRRGGAASPSSINMQTMAQSIADAVGGLWRQADQATGGWLPGGGVASPLTRAIYPPQPYPGRSEELERITGVKARIVDPNKTPTLVSRLAPSFSSVWGENDYANPLLGEIGMRDYRGGVQGSRESHVEMHELGHLNTGDKEIYSYFGVLGRALEGLSQQLGSPALLDLAAGMAMTNLDAKEEDRAERFAAKNTNTYSTLISPDGRSGYGDSLRRQGSELISSGKERLANPFGIVTALNQKRSEALQKDYNRLLEQQVEQLRANPDLGITKSVPPEYIKLNQQIEELGSRLEALGVASPIDEFLKQRKPGATGQEGASLPGGAFDVSKVATDFGTIAAASILRGVLDNSEVFGASGSMQIAQASNVKVGDQVGSDSPRPQKANAPAISGAAATTQARKDLGAETLGVLDQKKLQNLQNYFAAINEDGIEIVNNLKQQGEQLDAQLLLMEGGLEPSLAQQLVLQDKIYNSAVTELEGRRKKVLDDKYDPSVVEEFYNTELKLLKANNIEIKQRTVQYARQSEYLLAIASLNQQLAVTGVAEQAGFFGAGASAFTSELSRSGDVGQATDLAELTRLLEAKRAIADIRGELNSLADPINVAITAANGIGVAFAQAFQGLIDGSMSAREALGGFFKSVGDMFLEMAAQIIAKQVTMIILQTILKALGAVGGDPVKPGGDWMSAVGRMSPNANGNAFGANGIMPFAKGGAFTNSIVSSPTLFKFADGGAMRTGLMGEAGPEAIMPLKRGADGSLGVQANGLREAMDRPPGGASGSPVLNMSFQSTTINGVEYVSREQLESAMAETRRNATRDGAKRGMTMTLDRIQNSSSTRRKVGI